MVAHAWVQNPIFGRPHLTLLGTGAPGGGRAQQERRDYSAEMGDVELRGLFAVARAGEGRGEMLLQGEEYVQSRFLHNDHVVSS